MLLGILMLLTTGLAWAFTGVLLSYCARSRIRAVTPLGPQMAAVGFPIAVGTCIVGFGLYSAVVLREPFTRWHLVGMALGVVGVVCVSTNG